jgi:hypothetical protein
MPHRRHSLSARFSTAATLILLAVPAGAEHASPDAAFVRDGAAAPVSEPGARTAGGSPFVVVDGDGRFLVVWSETFAQDETPAFRARRFRADGVPLTDVVSLDHLVGGVSDVAMAPDGRWAVTWTNGTVVLLRRFAPDGTPEGSANRIDSGTFPAGVELLGVERPAIAMAPDGSGLALWEQRLIAPGSGFEFEFSRVVSRRFGSDGQPLGEEVERSVWLADVVPFDGGFDAAFSSDGRALLAAVQQGGDPSFGRLATTLLATDGTPIPLDPAAAELHPSEDRPRIAADGHGLFALGFAGGVGQGPDGRDGSCSGAFVRFYGVDGSALAPERRVHPETLGCQGFVDVAGLSTGGWLVLWTGAFADSFFGTDPSRQGLWATTYDSTGEQVGEPVRLLAGTDAATAVAGGAEVAVLAEQRFAGVRHHLLRPAGDAECVGPVLAAPLCLGGGRWRVDVTWRDPYNGGPAGDSHPEPLVADTGAFWFFRPDNLELMIKVLDARPVNGHWWVFYGSLTTVETWIDVTDLATGRQASYHNPPFVQASRADTAAFDDLGPVGGLGSLAAPAAVAVPDPPNPPRPGVELAAAGPPARRAAAPAEDTPACADGPDRLCLHQRFLVEVDWRNPRDGGSGQGRAVPINPGSGAFWFFAPTNLELLVKVIDGRPANGHWWVFHGGLSDVEYTLTVSDTHLGGTATYRSAPFELTGGADTAAFPEEPAQP